ncbi:MAG: hypothetical protein JW800_01520, partial [Candidatus Omnitrophica bacterium]|nr:hypothetical protein [Candidatus Omnitrophota bacterium]
MIPLNVRKFFLKNKILRSSLKYVPDPLFFSCTALIAFIRGSLGGSGGVRYPIVKDMDAYERLFIGSEENFEKIVS